MSISGYKEGTILIPRPVHELCHKLARFEVPTLELVIRAVKVVAMSVFRWHLCDTGSVMVCSESTYIREVSGTIEAQMHGLYAIPSVIALVPTTKISITFKEIQALGTISLQNVVTYYRENLGVTDLQDVWNHPGFEMSYSKA